MTTPDPAPAPEAATAADAAIATRRLHPWSWLFVLLQQLKQFIVPLIALVAFGSRSEHGTAWWPLVGVAVLVVASVWRYFTFRYGVADDRVVVRTGLLERNVRQVPFARIHNVALHQSLLHRLFGVAEVRLESAGGKEAEAQMRVLPMAEALALERLVRRRGAGAAMPGGDAAAAEADTRATTLLALSTPEVVRVGLVSNRGMLVVAGAFALAWQLFPERQVARWFNDVGSQLFGYVSHLQGGWAARAATAALLVLGALLLVRLFSVVIALVQYHGFRLEEDGRRLIVTRGLLSRLRTSVPRRRIQAFTLYEGLLHRLLRRRTLAVDTAAGGGEGNAEGGQAGARALRELAPVATADRCDALARHVLRDAQWPPAAHAWILLPASAWLRMWWPSWLLVAAACAVVGWRHGAWGLLPLLWLPWSALTARRRAARTGVHVDDRLVAMRGGWWSRHWRFAEIDKVQALAIERSWLDRRCGTATLSFDTAGASALGGGLRCPLLPVSQARALHDAVAQKVAQRPMRW